MNTSPNSTSPVTFNVHRDGKLVRVTYQQVFTAAHKLWLAERYAEAGELFKRLAEVPDQGPRAHILRAHCQAMTADYAGCSSTLSEALDSTEFGDAASDLHFAFVMWKCTMYVDVRAELEKVIQEHQELPTPCLLLADLLMHCGNRLRPPRLLKQAIERDRPNGAIATIARIELPFALEMARSAPVRKSRPKEPRTK